MDTNGTVETQLLLAVHQMVRDEKTGSLTFHFNRGMVQKIERTEFQAVVPAVKH